MQLLVAKEHLDELEELQTQWKVDGKSDDDIFAELEKLEDAGKVPLFWISGMFTLVDINASDIEDGMIIDFCFVVLGRRFRFGCSGN